MKDQCDWKKVMITVAKIIAFLAFLNLVGFMIGKGIQKAMKLSKKAKHAAKKEGKEKCDCDCHDEEDEECCCDKHDNEHVEEDDGCDGYCCEDEEEEEEAPCETTPSCTCKEGEGCTCEDPCAEEEKKPV